MEESSHSVVPVGVVSIVAVGLPVGDAVSMAAKVGESVKTRGSSTPRDPMGFSVGDPVRAVVGTPAGSSVAGFAGESIEVSVGENVGICVGINVGEVVSSTSVGW